MRLREYIRLYSLGACVYHFMRIDAIGTLSLPMRAGIGREPSAGGWVFLHVRIEDWRANPFPFHELMPAEAMARKAAHGLVTGYPRFGKANRTRAEASPDPHFG